MQLAFLGGAPVDHHLVVRTRRTPCHDAIWVERGNTDPVRGGRGRPVPADALAVAADELSEALDVGHRAGYPRRRTGQAEQRGVYAGAALVDVRADLRRAAQDHVGAAVRGREQLVEVRLERVAEQQRYGEEGHPEYDCDHAA